MPDIYKTDITFPKKQKSFDLDVETISDGFQKSIVKHEFPNTNGALLEDMGQKARQISVRVYFFNDTYLDHLEFLDALDETDAIGLTHPIYGPISGSIESVNVRHNDRLQTAEIDITFIEGRIEDTTRTEISMPGAGESAFLDGIDEQQNEFANDMADDMGTDGASAAARALDPSQSIISQFQDASGKMRAYVGQVDAAVNTFQATLVTVTQPVNTVLATVQFSANLPGRVIGAIAQTVERVAETYQALRTFPAQFQRSLKSGLDQLESSFRAFQSKAPAGSARNIAETAAMTMIANHIRLASAHRLALEAAYGMANDQANRQAAKKNENQQSFDILGNYYNPVAPDRIMSRHNIEATLLIVMNAAQNTVDIMRGTQQIKRACAGLVEYARQTMIEAHQVTTVDIEGTLPLHLILLKYGLPYNAADRVLAINPQIRHPNFVSGTINIYVAG